MNHQKAVLISELVGLARATDGNEHLINSSATDIIRKVLLAKENQLNEAEIAHLRDEILAQKRNMVPDCFHCAAPCGKTSAYDLTSIQDHKEFKEKILTDLTSLETIPEEFLYKGLIILGMDDIYPELEEFWNSAMKNL